MESNFFFLFPVPSILPENNQFHEKKYLNKTQLHGNINFVPIPRNSQLLLHFFPLFQILVIGFKKIWGTLFLKKKTKPLKIQTVLFTHELQVTTDLPIDLFKSLSSTVKIQRILKFQFDFIGKLFNSNNRLHWFKQFEVFHFSLLFSSFSLQAYNWMTFKGLFS